MSLKYAKPLFAMEEFTLPTYSLILQYFNQNNIIIIYIAGITLRYIKKSIVYFQSKYSYIVKYDDLRRFRVVKRQRICIGEVWIVWVLQYCIKVYVHAQGHNEVNTYTVYGNLSIIVCTFHTLFVTIVLFEYVFYLLTYLPSCIILE